MREFETGATRDDDTTKLDYEGFLSPFVMQRFAQYMHEHRVQADGVLRDSDNWQKGIPKEAYIKSMFRHFMELWTMWREETQSFMLMENVLCALMFNVMGMLHEVLKRGRYNALRVVATEANTINVHRGSNAGGAPVKLPSVLRSGGGIEEFGVHSPKSGAHGYSTGSGLVPPPRLAFDPGWPPRR